MDWQTKELKDKKRAERESKRISSKHNLLGELEECPHRGKEMPVRWTKEGSTWHVEPSSVAFGTKGFRISAEDWTRIFGTPEEKAALEDPKS